MSNLTRLNDYLKYLEGVNFLSGEAEYFKSNKLVKIDISAFGNATLPVLRKIVSTVLESDYFQSDPDIEVVSIIFYVMDDVFTFRRNIKKETTEIYKNGNKII